jgi:general L-amino acid transport system substrate-binding protein
VKKVGNYAESYERHVGPKTPIKLERGANALWKHGGLQYPMPVR